MKQQSIKRLFIAIDMPPSIIKELKRVQRFLKREEVFKGHYVDTAHAHITVKFLGDIEEFLIPAIQERLKTIQLQTMHAYLGKLDLFKPAKNNMPRVIFLTVICPKLTDLAQQIEHALSDLLRSENRSFVSHLTIARVKEIADYDILADLLDQFKVKPILFDIDSFVLKQSELSSEGSTHTEIARYRLGV